MFPGGGPGFRPYNGYGMQGPPHQMNMNMMQGNGPPRGGRGGPVSIYLIVRLFNRVKKFESRTFQQYTSLILGIFTI